MTVESKRELGQYFTKDEVWLRPHIKEHIISLMEKYKLCVDPFAGDGHLLNIAKVFGYETVGHDIDADICKKNGWGVPNDSLMNVIRHKDAFVLTNPPYLAKNSAKRMKSEMVSYFQPGAIPGIEIEMLGVLDDLFKFAIEKVLQTYSESIWIVPESGIQDLDDLNHWMKDLHSVTILEQNPFDDTEHPVCVMIFSRSNPKQEIWKNDELLGKYVDIKSVHDKFSKGSSRSTPMKFNSAGGSLGFRAVDGTREDGSMRIKFCRGEELGYPRENIKVSSRHLTYIEIELEGHTLDATIDEANRTIDEYREATHDVFLTAFMGNTKTGERRRRLDYKLARRIFNKAYAKFDTRPTLDDY